MSGNTHQWLSEYVALVLEQNPGLEPLFRASQFHQDPAAVVSFFSPRTFAPGDILVSQQTEGGEFLLIVEGRARVEERPKAVSGRLGEVQYVNELQAPDILGEVSLVLKMPRIATVTAVSEIRALAFTQDDLNKLCSFDSLLATMLLRWFAEDVVIKIQRTRWFHDIVPAGAEVKEVPVEQFQKGASRRKYDKKGDLDDQIVDRLSELTCFGWQEEDIDPSVAELFRLCRVARGKAIIADKEPGDSLFLLSEGAAMIQDSGGTPVRGFLAGHPRSIHILMGEMCFLHPDPRTGSIIAEEDCALLEISSDKTVALVQRAPWIAIYLHQGILQAISRKLVETSSARAHYQALLGGDWEQWFVDQDHYLLRMPAK